MQLGIPLKDVHKQDGLLTPQEVNDMLQLVFSAAYLNPRPENNWSVSRRASYFVQVLAQCVRGSSGGEGPSVVDLVVRAHSRSSNFDDVTSLTAMFDSKGRLRSRAWDTGTCKSPRRTSSRRSPARRLILNLVRACRTTRTRSWRTSLGLRSLCVCPSRRVCHLCGGCWRADGLTL